MNPFIKDQIESLVRKALAGVIPWLVATQLLDATQAAQLMSIVAGLVVAGIWGFFTGKFKRQKQLTAQVLPQGTTENELKAVVESGAAPSVMTAADVVPKLASVS